MHFDRFHFCSHIPCYWRAIAYSLDSLASSPCSYLQSIWTISIEARPICVDDSKMLTYNGERRIYRHYSYTDSTRSPANVELICRALNFPHFFRCSCALHYILHISHAAAARYALKLYVVILIINFVLLDFPSIQIYLWLACFHH